jgi:hypothetical protein
MSCFLRDMLIFVFVVGGENLKQLKKLNVKLYFSVEVTLYLKSVYETGQ